MALFPPRNLGLSGTLYFTRRIKGKVITVWLPDGSSYDLIPDDLVSWLGSLGNVDPGFAVDYTWNFYSVQYDPRKHTHEWISPEDLPNATRRAHRAYCPIVR